ncbi:MAG: helix-turn-helix transcriptional regulator [Oscillospiraceae bacterium]|jgi:transcriptional regulator with XRE-family HTH domain|nr:helix-turn-helix transcriptional regulator [Oscillospiraceae bacterium]
MDINYAQIGKRIRIFRKRKGWTQEKLAEVANKSNTYLSLVENGKKSVSLAALTAIANALETTIDPLMLGNLKADAPMCITGIELLISGCSAAQRTQIIAIIVAIKVTWKDEEASKREERE